MPNLYKITAGKETTDLSLAKSEIFAVAYHDLFDFPLNMSEMIRWRYNEEAVVDHMEYIINSRGGFYFVEGKDGIVYKRLLRKRISQKKLEIARKASSILSVIPSIKMIAITGSLAMANATDESDIDLMVITKEGTLWTSRLISYILLKMFGLKTRAPNDTKQRDKLCMNIWMDESDLAWTDKMNLYTAHEIAQIVPLINKNKTYEKFLNTNKWVLDYWPNAVRIEDEVTKIKKVKLSHKFFSVIEKLCYVFQYQYMRSKISREVISPTRALFHPQDWSEVVLSRFSP